MSVSPVSVPSVSVPPVSVPSVAVPPVYVAEVGIMTAAERAEQRRQAIASACSSISSGRAKQSSSKLQSSAHLNIVQRCLLAVKNLLLTMLRLFSSWTGCFQAGCCWMAETSQGVCITGHVCQ